MNSLDLKKQYGQESALMALISTALIILLLIFLLGAEESATAFKEFFYNIIVTAIVISASAFLLGRLAGARFQDRINPYLAAFFITIISLKIGLLAGSLAGYFTLAKGNEGDVFDYIFKPVLIMLIYGSIPTIGFAIILGYRLKLRRDKYISNKKQSNK